VVAGGLARLAGAQVCVATSRSRAAQLCEQFEAGSGEPGKELTLRVSRRAAGHH
jgi:hypothetical protein